MPIAFAGSFLTEKAKYRQPILMYHGTTSQYLHSILKQGIVPDPKQKTWADDPAASLVQSNRSSLFGSYWTSNFMTAESSAFASARKFGGQILIVMAMLAEGSAFADEDSLNLNRPWAELMHDFGIVPDAVRIPAYIYYARSHSDRPDIRDYEDNKLDQQRAKMLHDFGTHLHNLWGTKEQPIDRTLAHETFEAYLVRQLAHSSQDYYSPLSDVDERDRPDLPSPDQADANLLRIQDKLTRRYRRSAYQGQSRFIHTLRMPTPVGYAGSNKIVCIIEEDRRMYGDPVRPARLWYGKDVPQDYLNQYRDRIGAYPGLVDGRTGATLLPADSQ